MARFARRIIVTITVLLTMLVGLEPTKAAAAAPPAVTNLSAYPMIGSVRLQWENPVASPDYFETVLVGRPGTVAPTSLTDGREILRSNVFTAKIVDFLTPGSSYSFTVFPVDSTNVPGPGTSITIFGTSLSLSVSRTSVGYGSAVTVRGSLVDAATGVGPVDEPVDIYARARGTRQWEWVTTVNTGPNGSFAVADRPPLNAEYEALYYGSNTHFGDTAGPVGVSVAPAVSLRVNRTSMPRGGTVTFTTAVGPRHNGQKVYLQRLVGRVWRTVSARVLSSASTAAFPLRLTTPGAFRYRVYKPADSDHVASFSRVVAVRAI